MLVLEKPQELFVGNHGAIFGQPSQFFDNRPDHFGFGGGGFDLSVGCKSGNQRFNQCPALEGRTVEFFQTLIPFCFNWEMISSTDLAPMFLTLAISTAETLAR